jgi:hypothetical protein
VQLSVPAGRCQRFALALSLLVLAAVFADSAQALRATQPSGRAGCIDAAGSHGCARAPALSEVGPIAVSPNGAFLYAFNAAPPGPDALLARMLIFARNPRTGALRQLPGRRGCLENTFKPVRRQRGPCERVGGLEVPKELAISPDGRRLYATDAFDGNYLVTFALNPRTGAADKLQCLTNLRPSRCTLTKPELQEPDALIVSPDSRYVYVASQTEFPSPHTPLLDVYRAGPRGLGPQQCIAQEAVPALGCIAVPLLGDASVSGLAEAPDGSVVYAAAAGRVVALARDPTSGRLTPLSGPGDCVSDEHTPPAGCSAVALIGTDLVMGASADTLYTATQEMGTFAVAALTREGPAGGLGEPSGPAGCAAFMGLGGIPGCGPLPNWVGSLALGLPTLSPRPDVLLAGFDGGPDFGDERGRSTDSVVQITRSPLTSALEATDLRSCEPPTACPPLRGTEANLASIASSPDGRSIYLADGSGIAQLRPSP